MSYTYDGNGERVLKSNTSTGAAVKRYWSMAGNTLAEGDASGNLTAEYIYFGGRRVARIDLPANTVHYYLSDHLGSTSIVANAAGVVEEESDYYPFGTEVVVTGPGANELKFTGKRRDAESGLDNFGARYNSSSLGRFMTPDWSAQPVAVPFADLSDPQTLNLYTYVRNSPLNRTDPTGHYEVNASGCSGNNSAKCQKKYDKATTRFEEARQKDLQSKDPKVRAAAAAYGDPGKKNGVHLAFEDLKSQGIDGSVNAISNNGKGKVIDVEVKIDINEKGKSLQETVAHEGAHVSKDLNFLTSYDFGTGRYNSTMNFTGRQTEFLGYQTGAGVTRDRGFGPNDTQKINDYITHHYAPNYLNNDYFPNNASFPQ
jgi:RHS repeat-associated protein